MKRIGNLFEKAFSHDSLYRAWKTASRGKRKKQATMEFSRNLGTNLKALHDELNGNMYKPQDYTVFLVYEPKKRTIYAPAFRDLVVQHAIYRLIYPIFNSGFIDQSFACRKGKGTHAAADYTQTALRASDPKSYLLQLDIRKFFYCIDRDILRKQIEHKIKDHRFVKLMMLFADYGQMLGIPIGNLLSQTYALIYLNPLDHFIKRELRVSLYCRYVDDFILFNLTRNQCVRFLECIKVFLREKLHLELSRFSFIPVTRGVNFVGYRTWRSIRFIRKHSLYSFTKSAKQNALQSVISILGHAKRTASSCHLLTFLKEKHHALFNRIPPRCYIHLHSFA